MQKNVYPLIKENWKSDNTLGEIFCVIPELYKYVDIKKVGFSTRVYSALKRGGRTFSINSVRDLLILTVSDLFTIRNLGEIALKEIFERTIDYLEKHKPEHPDEYIEEDDDLLYAKDKYGNDIFDTQSILGENVREIRKSKKLSQTDFANKCGITLSILKSIENDTSNPKLSTLKRIADYSGCSVSELFDEK